MIIQWSLKRDVEGKEKRKYELSFFFWEQFIASKGERFDREDMIEQWDGDMRFFLKRWIFRHWMKMWSGLLLSGFLTCGLGDGRRLGRASRNQDMTQKVRCSRSYLRHKQPSLSCRSLNLSDDFGIGPYRQKFPNLVVSPGSRHFLCHLCLNDPSSPRMFVLFQFCASRMIEVS